MDSVNVESVGFILVCWFLTVKNYCCMHIFCRDSCFFSSHTLCVPFGHERGERENTFLFSPPIERRQALSIVSSSVQLSPRREKLWLGGETWIYQENE